MAKDTRELTAEELADVMGGCGFFQNAVRVNEAYMHAYADTLHATHSFVLANWSARTHAWAEMAEIASESYGGHGHGDSADASTREGNQGSETSTPGATTAPPVVAAAGGPAAPPTAGLTAGPPESPATTNAVGSLITLSPEELAAFAASAAKAAVEEYKATAPTKEVYIVDELPDAPDLEDVGRGWSEAGVIEVVDASGTGASEPTAGTAAEPEPEPEPAAEPGPMGFPRATV
jgi:hypothetical protein